MHATNRFLKVSALAIVCLLACGTVAMHAQAQTTVNTSWTGTSLFGNWTTASNWSCNCVPNNGTTDLYNVTLSTPTFVSLDNTSSEKSATISNLSLGGYLISLGIQNGESLNVIGNLTNYTGVGTDNQAIRIGSNGTLSVGGATNNVGNIILDSGVLKTGDFTNSGFIQIGPTAGTLLSVSPGGAYTQTAGFTHLVSAVVTGVPQSFGTLMAPGVDIVGGSLYGTGTVAGNLANNGVVLPGDACLCDGVLYPYPNLPSTTMPINGNYSQTARGTLLIAISSATNFSILDVGGDAALGGTVDFDFLNGYVPGANTDFAFLNAGTVSGDFGTLDYMGINCPTCTFNLKTLSLDTGSTPPTYRPPVPEAGTSILLGTGLLALACLLRRSVLITSYRYQGA